MLFRSRRLWTPVVLGVALATFAGLAATSHGFPVQHASLNNGGIWVTNSSQGIVGQFVKPIAQLDARIAPTSESAGVNVWQNGPAVATYDENGHRIYAVNASGLALYDSGQAISPTSGGIALGDTTLAVLSADHTLRATALGAGGGTLAALAPTAKPLATNLPANAAVAVGTDDTIWVAGGGELRGFYAGNSVPAVSSLLLSAADPMQVATVGNVPVVADAATGRLYLPGSGTVVGLPTASGLELQQSSGASDVVIAATGQALYSVNLSTGQLTTLSTGHSGVVAAPVQLSGCVYAAWAGTVAGSYVQTCGSPPPATSDARAFPVGDSAGTPSLVFRVNEDSVVLNDTTDGYVFFLAGNTIATVKPQWQLNGTVHRGDNQANEPQSIPLTASPVTQGAGHDDGGPRTRHRERQPRRHLRRDRARPARPARRPRHDRARRADRARHGDSTLHRRPLLVHDQRRAHPQRLKRGNPGAARSRPERGARAAGELPAAGPQGRRGRDPGRPGHR
jgi:hypothetical protein